LLIPIPCRGSITFNDEILGERSGEIEMVWERACTPVYWDTAGEEDINCENDLITAIMYRISTYIRRQRHRERDTHTHGKI